MSGDGGAAEGGRGGGFVLWLTGPPCAGKTTLARALRARLAGARGVELLDGDEVRAALSRGLGFSREDRDENVRRIGFVARLLARNGVAVIVAAVSPYRATRAEVAAALRAEGIPVLEAHVDAPLDVLVARDGKGLYRKALAGELPRFTGVSDPYEPPDPADVRLRTDREPIDVCVERLVAALRSRGLC